MDQNKKTIFLTIGTGVVARNFLDNNFFERLKEGYKIVIFTPLWNDKDFCERFGGKDIYFEKIIHRRLTRVELFFISLHKALIYNESVKIKSFYSLSSTMKQKRTPWKIIKNYIELVIFGGILSKLIFLRRFVKWLDRMIYTEEFYRDVYERYNPVLVFITNMGADDEVYLLRSAIRRKIPNIGMAKSWDNFSKIGFREWVDKVVVWSDYMKDEVLSYQNYKERDIEIIGIPQFDVLSEIKVTHTREDFIKTYRLDPSKKTILFGQSNPLLNPDDAYVCSVIKDWIVRTGSKYQLFIRPHYRHKDAEKPFLPLVDNKNVFIDLLNDPSNFESGAWDLSMDSQIRRALSLRFCDVVVNSTSTILLDTICSDNHYICYAFDKDKNLSYGDSVKRIFDLLWYIDMRKHGFESYMVFNEEELIRRLEYFLQGPKKALPKENQQMIDRFCYKADGKAGERLFKIVTSLS